ncbi:hypothetical protein B0J13DRAFT_459387, partial [Dactylonectria estremocensis]
MEQERFKMWATNAAAFGQGRGSLDYRFRELPEELDPMRMLLGNLYYTLHEYVAAANIARLDGRLGLGTEDGSSRTRLKTFDYDEALDSIHSSIDWLHRLSNLLRRAGVANQNMRAKSYNMVDLDEDGLKFFFESLISRDFPSLSEQLKSRMASTMVERYRRILYRRARLRSGLGQQESIGSEAGPKKPAPARTSPSQLKAKIAPVPSTEKTRQPGNLLAAPSPSIFSSNTRTDPNPSVYRAYAASAVSKARSVALNQTAELLLPPPPSACRTGPNFVCDFCCIILDSRVGKDDALWKKHMQQDLDPYICLFDRCNVPHDMYSTSKEWLHHMREEHLVKWRCSATDHDDVLDFCTKEELAEHMSSGHPNTFDEELLPYVLDACRISSAVVFESCPFCGQSLDAIEEHVSHHLRYLALKSLPWPEIADEV